MKVFGVGLSRTGTKSLTRALTNLGFDAVHYPKPHKILSVAQNHDALTDIPVVLAYQELDTIYPDAKFILTVRNLPDWLDSCERHWRRKKWRSRGPVPRIVRRAVYGRLDFEREWFRRVYRQHETAVKQWFAERSGKLLIMDITSGDGYENLCPFLGFNVLSDKFPHENKG